jgi:hypothetical protein
VHDAITLDENLINSNGVNFPNKNLLAIPPTTPIKLSHSARGWRKQQNIFREIEKTPLDPPDDYQPLQAVQFYD